MMESIFGKSESNLSRLATVTGDRTDSTSGMRSHACKRVGLPLKIVNSDIGRVRLFIVGSIAMLAIGTALDGTLLYSIRQPS